MSISSLLTNIGIDADSFLDQLTVQEQRLLVRQSLWSWNKLSHEQREVFGSAILKALPHMQKHKKNYLLIGNIIKKMKKFSTYESATAYPELAWAIISNSKTPSSIALKVIENVRNNTGHNFWIALLVYHGVKKYTNELLPFLDDIKVVEDLIYSSKYLFLSQKALDYIWSKHSGHYVVFCNMVRFKNCSADVLEESFPKESGWKNRFPDYWTHHIRHKHCSKKLYDSAWQKRDSLFLDDHGLHLIIMYGLFIQSRWFSPEVAIAILNEAKTQVQNVLCSWRSEFVRVLGEETLDGMVAAINLSA